MSAAALAVVPVSRLVVDMVRNITQSGTREWVTNNLVAYHRVHLDDLPLEVGASLVDEVHEMRAGPSDFYAKQALRIFMLGYSMGMATANG